MKSAFVSIVGRPSSGKSTLLNRFCGNKVSIVSRVPQTTRNKIRGIVNREQGQLVFVDTPGFHISDKKFNKYLMGLVSSSLEDADLVLFLIDISRASREEDQEILRLLSGFEGPIIIALNKIDLHPKPKPETLELLSNVEYGILPVSALTGEGVEELLSEIFRQSPDGDPFYPDDFYTDQDPEFRISEIIREMALDQVRQEVPHSLYVEVAESEFQGEVLWVRAFVCVARESQKGIVVGAGGNRIKTIRLQAEKELSGIFPYRIKLDLRVKVRKKWRRRDDFLKEIIH